MRSTARHVRFVAPPARPGASRAGRAQIMSAVGMVVAAIVLTASSAPTDRPAAAPQAVATSRPPAASVCGVADLATVTAPAQPPAGSPVRVVSGGSAVSSLVGAVLATGPRLYALDFGGSADRPPRVRSIGTDGTVHSSFTLPLLATPALAADAGGNVYVARAPNDVVKFGPTGAVVWSATFDHVVDGLYLVGAGDNLRVGVVERTRRGSWLLDSTGARVGSSLVTGTAFTPTPDGGLLATDGAYVRRYSASGAEQLVFGDRRVANDPQHTGGPLHFYQQGGAAVGHDGTLYVADATVGIHAASPEGFHRGVAADDRLGHLSERSWLVPLDGRLFFSAGGRFNPNQTVSSVSFPELAALVAEPKRPRPVLGFGAGLESGAVGQYVPPGAVPSVWASFDPWWSAPVAAKGLSLTYTVRERKQVLAGQVPTETRRTLPADAVSLAKVALTLPDARPGAYEVDARLVTSAGEVVGATCFRYTVGAPGHRLDFAALPAGVDTGGPAPARAVALAGQLGLGGVRARVEWSKLMPDPAAALDFSAYDKAFRDAARDAAARGVGFWVQVGEGGVERQLVTNGTWEGRVGELVTHFAGVVSGWEAWNEPNHTFGAADAYVTQVLKPFARAVRSADPDAKVIGGSTLRVDLPYWRGIIAAGGLPFVDIVAVHPWTGHNRSWEEQGTPAAIEALKAELAAAGAGSKPIWDTESAWWSDGPGNTYAQADNVARGVLWGRALGIERWSYHIPEGSWGDYGLSYSLIEATAQPDFVKPAALAVMTATDQTAGRPFTGNVTTGVPHTQAFGFGERPGAATKVVALWSDGLDVPVAVTTNKAATVTVTDLLGQATPTAFSANQARTIAASASPVYLSAPSGVQVRLAPTGRAFGTNVAAASAGAKVGASTATAENGAALAVDGRSDAADGGDLPGLSAWASAPGDLSRTLTVALPKATTVDRVLVSGHSVGSLVPGLRDFDVEVQARNGTWERFGVRDQFHTRRRLVSFPARQVMAIRLTVHDVNFGGLAGGLRPWFWLPDAAGSPWYGPAAVYEVEAFGG